MRFRAGIEPRRLAASPSLAQEDMLNCAIRAANCATMLAAIEYTIAEDARLRTGLLQLAIIAHVARRVTRRQAKSGADK